MGDASKIEWTDSTWNPVVGCSIVSPGCTHCYAMKMAARIEAMQPSSHYAGTTQGGKRHAVWSGKVALAPDHILDRPLRWQKPRNIFVNSMSDLFHEAMSDDAIDKVFAVMALAPQHTFQVLTKRADRMRRYLESDRRDDWVKASWPFGEDAPLTAQQYADRSHMGPPGQKVSRFNQRHLPNVLIGVSVEDQPRADERREHLAAIAGMGWRTFVSYEPALGPVDWTGWEFLKWMICGFESGPRARPGHPDWARATRDYCAPRLIPFFFKQWGEFAPDDPAAAHTSMRRVGKRAAGRLLDGVEHNGMPELRR